MDENKKHHVTRSNAVKGDPTRACDRSGQKAEIRTRAEHLFFFFSPPPPSATQFRRTAGSWVRERGIARSKRKYEFRNPTVTNRFFRPLRRYG